jgi:energy-coupling factor transport system substrate-specific component
VLSRIWLRVLVGGAALVGTVVVGLTGTSFDTTPGAGGVPAGANQLMVVLALALIVGFLFYEAVEWLQTRRLDSIAHQFTTRTIVLMPVAIALNIVLGQTVGSALKLPIYLDSIGTILVGVLAGPFAGAATGLLSNLAWTFLLAGTPFGSGVFGYVGAFRPRPRSSPATLIAGVVAAAVLLGGLIWYGILPFYRDLCPEPVAGGARQGLCFDLLADGTIDPLFVGLTLVLGAIIVVAAIVLVVRLARDRDLGVVFVLVAGAVCGIVSAFISTPIAALVFGGVTGSGTDLLVAAFQQAGSSLEDAVRQQSLISDPIDKTITYLIVYTLLASMSRRLTARFPQGERALGTVEG